MFLRTVREPSKFGQALLVVYTGIFCTAQFQIALIFEVEKKFSQHDFELKNTEDCSYKKKIKSHFDLYSTNFAKHRFFGCNFEIDKSH